MDRLVLMAVVLLGVGCTSPEATRSRGGGSGADIGNRGAEVLTHEGSKPFHGTPTLQPTRPPPLESAADAHARSTAR